MATLQGPVVCGPALQSSAGSNHDLVAPWVFAPCVGKGSLKSRIWGARPCGAALRPAACAFKLSRSSESRIIECNASMPSDNSGNSTEGFSGKDDDYVNSSVLEAVEVKCGSAGFMIKMRDGSYVQCVHNNPESGRLPDYASQPAIVLKMEDGSNLLLPIIVLDLPCTMLMEAMRNVHVSRPTIYQVLKDMIELTGFKVKLVRVTRRVHEAYFAQLHLCKQAGDETQEVSLDLRPSDAINIAVRCQVPIQVNRHLAYGDGVKIISDPIVSPFRNQRPRFGLITELDRPETDSCMAAEEFGLIRSMMTAAVEERYTDAARLRDELSELRSKKNGQQKQA